IKEMDAAASVAPEVLQMVDGMRRCAVNMYTLVNDLLDPTRIIDGLPLLPRPTNIGDYLEALMVNFQVLAEHKGISLQLVRPSGELVARIDPIRFSQVINNLLSNAIKYTPSGGSIEISTFEDGHQVAFQVADSGIGIPEDALPHVFEKYYRVDTAE